MHILKNYIQVGEWGGNDLRQDIEGETIEWSSNLSPCFIVLEASDMENYSLLEKIFEAVDVSLSNDATLVSLPEGKSVFRIMDITKDGLPDKVFLFGVPPERLCLNYSVVPYYPVELAGITFTICDRLDKLASNRDLKKKLWDALRQVYDK